MGKGGWAGGRDGGKWKNEEARRPRQLHRGSHRLAVRCRQRSGRGVVWVLILVRVWLQECVCTYGVGARVCNGERKGKRLKLWVWVWVCGCGCEGQERGKLVEVCLHARA